MAKLGSIFKNVAKAGKKINAGKFLKGKKEGLLNSVKGGIKGLQQSKVKGKNSLLNVKSLEPIRPDLKQGGVRKVGRLVTNKVQSLVPKIAKTVTSKVNQFDPNALLGKIFDGGLNSLQSFASGLGGLKSSLQKNLEFLKEAKGIIVDLITKMAKAKPRSSGGFFKGLIKNIAKVGLLAMAFKAAPAAMGVAAVGGRMALGAGVLAAGGMLAGKAFGAVKRGLEKKKQDASKIDGDKFNEIIEKFQSELNMIERRKRRQKEEEPEKDEQEKTEEGSTDTDSTPTKSKVEPQDDPMGGKSPNAILKTEEGGKMIITPTQGGSEEKGDKVDSTIKPDAAEENKPQGLKRILAGGLDFATGNMFDFDSRGSNVDGIKNFLKGDKGKEGGKGGRGALGSQGEPGKKDMLSLAGDVIGITPMGIMAGGIIKGGEFIANKIGGQTEKGVESAGGRTRGKGKDKGSTIEPAPSDADAKLELSKDIAKPARQFFGQDGAGTPNGGILPVPIPAQNNKRRAGQTPIQRTQNSSKNMVPILPAIDMSNIHIQYSRSVFNIVDAM